MANEYAVNQTDLSSVANAIRTKGGTSAQLAFPSGFVTAIEGIKSGVTVQRSSASTSLTDSDKTINCGFQPDALFITLGEKYTTGGENFQMCTGVLFNEITSGYGFEVSFYSSDFKYLYLFWGKRTTTGFTLAYQRETLSSGATSGSSKSFNYVAVKYT